MSGNIHYGKQQYWLKRYYFIRMAFSVLWAITVFTAGQSSFIWVALLLILYPAWDAIANYLDAVKSGGVGRNRMQSVNIIVSIITTLAVVWTLSSSMNDVIRIFGLWAILTGLLQLGTATQRWKNYGAQWSMILSGAQSALAGAFFIYQARTPEPPSIANIAGYAAFGALYFGVSGLNLTFRQRSETRLQD
ncbi:DUF308 domain-containing protein [Klebsiella aerogenes]